jgi:hypothetical protein
MIPIQASAETRTRCGDSRTNRYADTYDRPDGEAEAALLASRFAGAVSVR